MLMKNTDHKMKLRPAAIRTLIRSASRFRDDESGVLVAFGVFMILIMLAVGGIGIDIMRFEYTRTSLQATLDRAVLAAADLDQTLDAEYVVEDYFAKSDMGEYLRSITVDEGLNYKEVSATADIEMNTQFIHMLGIEKLNALAGGTAAESVDGVEIAMVLDMSGSMFPRPTFERFPTPVLRPQLVERESRFADLSIVFRPHSEHEPARQFEGDA